MIVSTLKKPLRVVPTMPQRPPQANIPPTLAEREFLRDLVSRHVDARRTTLVPRSGMSKLAIAGCGALRLMKE